MKPNSSEMQPISPEYRRFVLDHAPEFVQTVSAAKKRGGVAATSLPAFRDNPFLLYAALWYAGTEGVAVTLTPPGAGPGNPPPRS